MLCLNFRKNGITPNEHKKPKHNNSMEDLKKIEDLTSYLLPIEPNTQKVKLSKRDS
jgi:hypothetical protein